MLSQSINTELINDLIQLLKYLSKTFALLLIEDHEMIDNFLGVATGGGGYWTLWFLPYNATCSDDSFFL